MSRSTDLLRKAAKALDDGQDPLMNPFLSENDVPLDECFDLAERLALGARLVAQAFEEPSSPEGMAVMLMIAKVAS